MMRLISSVFPGWPLKIGSTSVDAVGGVFSPYKDILSPQREEAQCQVMQSQGTQLSPEYDTSWPKTKTMLVEMLVGSKGLSLSECFEYTDDIRNQKPSHGGQKE